MAARQTTASNSIPLKKYKERNAGSIGDVISINSLVVVLFPLFQPYNALLYRLRCTLCAFVCPVSPGETTNLYFASPQGAKYKITDAVGKL